MGKKLYVGNLAYGMSDSDLQRLFEPHGTVQSAQVIIAADDLSRVFRATRLAIDLSVGEGSPPVQRVQRSRRGHELGTAHQ
jgi:RNA recognition motif-containing protein